MPVRQILVARRRATTSAPAPAEPEVQLGEQRLHPVHHQQPGHDVAGHAGPFPTSSQVFGRYYVFFEWLPIKVMIAIFWLLQHVILPVAMFCVGAYLAYLNARLWLENSLDGLFGLSEYFEARTSELLLNYIDAGNRVLRRCGFEEVPDAEFYVRFPNPDTLLAFVRTARRPAAQADRRVPRPEPSPAT